MSAHVRLRVSERQLRASLNIFASLTNPPLQKFVQQHSEEYGDGFSIEIYGTLDAETKEKFSATGFPIKYFDTRLGYSRCRE